MEPAQVPNALTVEGPLRAYRRAVTGKDRNLYEGRQPWVPYLRYGARYYGDLATLRDPRCIRLYGPGSLNSIVQVLTGFGDRPEPQILEDIPLWCIIQVRQSYVVPESVRRVSWCMFIAPTP